MKRNLVFFGFLYVFITGNIYANTTFDPPEARLNIFASRTTSKISIDGQLSDAAWKNIVPINGFVQQEPNPGEKATFDTDVYVLYDDNSIYFGFFCYDSLKANRVVVNSMKRDFGDNNDYINISIDAFYDKRTAFVFYANPYGAQGDLICIDDQLFDMDWNSVWKVQTSITDSGWIAEFEIPWKTLRYENRTTDQTFGINFGRCTRRINETSSWSPIPRVFGPNNMRYAGEIKLYNLPKPSTNIRLQPYALGNINQNTTNSSSAKDNTSTQNLNYGGEIKWAITSKTVLDLTYNTDFAQAEVDEQINNYDRFSVYFPEKRQFFLENASAFTPTFYTHYQNQPFYSRRIGLDDVGNPIPIVAGGRIVSKTDNNMIGALLIRQKASDYFPATNFGVFRYTNNLNENHQLGGLVSVRADEAFDSIASVQNYTATIDGVSQLSSSLRWTYMVSGTKTVGKNNGDGLSASSWFLKNTNNSVSWLTQTYIMDSYNPEAGFVNRKNIIYHAAGTRLRWRPEWRPKNVRTISPAIYFENYLNAKNQRYIEGIYTLRPFMIEFQNGAIIGWAIDYQYQNLEEDFYPLGIQIEMGEYHYLQYYASFLSDPSRRFAYTIAWRKGAFYDGLIDRYRFTLRYNIIPNISIAGDYFLTSFKNVGVNKIDLDVTLLSSELVLALNPKLQLTTRYQWNTANDMQNWNIRFSWEFRPLSYVYLIFNSNEWINSEATYANQNMIGKISYMMQF